MPHRAALAFAQPAVTLAFMAPTAPPGLRIVSLRAHPRHVPFIAGLVYREFWAGVEGGLTEAYLARAFAGQAEPGRVLHSCLALLHEEPVGCVHLIDHDDSELADLTPWLAAMVVVPGRRGQGIGSCLVQALLAQARALGVERLWLGTDGPGFYERLGARRHLQRSETFWTMVFDLGSAPATA